MEPLEKLDYCYNALVSGELITVRTSTREFSGQVFDVSRSPYGDDLAGRFIVGVVEDDGKVDYFRPLRDDCAFNH